MSMFLRSCVVFAIGMPLSSLFAADWPQFRGIQRDGISRETGLLKKWPDNGPPLVWTFDKAGVGYSGPAIVGDRLYMMGARGQSEFLFALDLKSAKGESVKELWSAQIGPLFTWKGNSWNDGPSATPVVDGDRVYAMGGLGDLICVQAGSGKEVWRKNLPKDLGGAVNDIGGGAEKLGWGFTCSPLVDGGQLLCVPGGGQGTLAALDKKTGSVIWRSKELKDEATYSSPLVADIGGVRQYIEMTNAGVAGVAAKDGKLLWYYHRKDPYGDVVIPTPIVHDNLVYTSVYGFGSDLVDVKGGGDKFAATPVYSNKTMLNQSGGMVLVGDHVYGYSEGKKSWTCQDFKKGTETWSERRKLGRGSVIAADGRLYCLGEDDGTVVLLEASPKAWTESGRFELPKKSDKRKPSGKVWTHPVIADGKLYLRDQELLFCFDVKEKK